MRAGPGIRSHGQRLGVDRQELLAETRASTAAALPLLIAVAVTVLRRAVAVVHGSGVDSAARLVLAGALSRTATLAPLAVTVLARALLGAATLALSLLDERLAWPVHDARGAVCVLSLRRAGRREGSILDSCFSR